MSCVFGIFFSLCCCAKCPGKFILSVVLTVHRKTLNFLVNLEFPCVTECIVCVPGHDPLTFSFLSFSPHFDWVGILWPQLSKALKLVRWASIVIVQELCESRGGRPGLPVLTSLLVSVDVKNY